MQADPEADVALAGLRSGAPAALVAVCRQRGAAVFTYCRQVVGEDAAGEVAAAALGQFRQAVIVHGGVASLRQAEPLLRLATRRAALLHSVSAPADPGEALTSDSCRGRAAEFLGYVENALSAADREAFTAHVEGCRACAATLQRLLAAERWFDVTDGPLPRSAGERMLQAMADAAPRGAGAADVASPPPVRTPAVRVPPTATATPVQPPASRRVQPPVPPSSMRTEAPDWRPDKPARVDAPGAFTPGPAARAGPRPEVAPAAKPSRALRRAGRRRPRSTHPEPVHAGVSMRSRVLRGVLTLAVVVVLSGVAGILFGVAMTALGNR